MKKKSQYTLQNKSRRREKANRKLGAW